MSIAVVLALVIFVQPIQSLAIDALSIFRVRDVNAITITINDIEQLAESIREIEALMPGKTKDPGNPPDHADIPDIRSKFVSIENQGDFTAFDLKLPRALNSETPKLMMLDAQTQTIAFYPDEMNSVLSSLGAQLLPNSAAGAEITIQSPAIIIAEYSENFLIATQMPVIKGDVETLDAISQSFLSLPQLTYNLRSQLADVDLTAGIVYVPVIEGFGRRTTIGNSTGYIYSMSDLETLVSGLSGDQQIPSMFGFAQDAYDDASVIIWTRGGVLYILKGNQSSSELTRIAGSLR